jgi:glutathione peroxidase
MGLESTLTAAWKWALKYLRATEGIKWNFTKFLVDAQGEVVGRYGSVDTPEKIEKDVLKLI